MEYNTQQQNEEKITHKISNSFSFPIALIIVGAVIAFGAMYNAGKSGGNNVSTGAQKNSEAILVEGGHEAFIACLESGKYADHIEADIQDALSAGGRGTPYSILIDQEGVLYPINGHVPLEQMQETIEKALAGTLNADSKVINIKKIKAISDTDHIYGNRDALIKIVEFSDTECPFCKQFHVVMQELVKQYDGQVMWVYRHFPLDVLHKKARKEAEAVECAGEIGGEKMFWKYLNRLFEVTPSNDRLDFKELYNVATFVGL